MKLEMMTFRSFAFALMFLASIVNFAQKGKDGIYPGPNTTFPLPILVEEVKKEGKEICIPYKRYKLDNGLNVIIHEDHSDPVVYVDVTYHVGSAREQQGRTGFAHFFEHMMFQGSKHVGDDEHFKIVSEAGGTMNGTTNTDRTNYFEVVPKNYLEKMLWLESDRMGFLLDSVTQKKFEIQRATVKNERGQRYDNAPYGLEREKSGEALYPQGHPNSWLTIGYIEDLNRVDVNDLKRFYMRWYGPNNAVLTIAGDVKTEEVLLLVQKYFGSINPGPAVNKMSVPPVKLQKNRYISYEDNVKFPMIGLYYPTVKDGEKDDAALTVLASLLSGTEDSPLRKAFIETKKATAAFAFQYGRELAGQFQIMVRANPETTLSVTEKEIKTALSAWEKKGISDDDLIKFKAQYHSRLYNSLQTVQGKGALLASNFTFFRNPNHLKKSIAQMMSVTKADVMRVYLTYIKNKPAVISSVVPKGKTELAAAPDNWKMYTKKVESESAEYKNLSYKMPVEELDRTKEPKEGSAAHAKVPDFYKTKISENIPVIGITENEIPKVVILLSFNAGHIFEPKEKSGLAQITSEMMNKSTMRTTKEELESRMDRLGASIGVASSEEEFYLFIDSPKENLASAMKIAEEILLEPKFDEKEFEVVKKSALDRIMQSQTAPASIASEVLHKLAYGTDHISAFPSIGTRETVASITLQDVKKFYEGLNSSMLSIAVSGDISQEEAINDLAFVSKLKKGEPLKVQEAKIPGIEKTKIYFVDKKNAAQSEIRFAYVGLPYDCCGELYKSNAMNYSFSGAFNSRINYTLREIKGWTYGSRGGFSGGMLPGLFSIGGGFKANTTDSTIREVMYQMKNFADNGITEKELEFTRHSLAQSDALKYESSFDKLNFIKNILDHDLPKDYVHEQEKVLESLTVQSVNEIAKKRLPYNNMIILVVGDKATNLEKVKQLGLEVVEIEYNTK